LDPAFLFFLILVKLKLCPSSNKKGTPWKLNPLQKEMQVKAAVCPIPPLATDEATLWTLIQDFTVFITSDLDTGFYCIHAANRKWI
jgi:hypothetical protein